MNLSAIDVNLVVALDALLRERSVTRAAHRVGLSQPAMSHALMRLREVLRDPLLVRVGRRMELTDRAEAMTGQVATLVQELTTLFTGEPPPFDPAACTRTFRIAANEYAQLLFLPQLHTALARVAPKAAIHAVPLSDPSTIEGLRAGEVDIAIGVFAPDELPPDVCCAELFQEGFVGLARLNHPSARGRISLETYASLGHIVVTGRGLRDGAVDDFVTARGAQRRIVVAVPHVFLAPHVVAASDLVAIVTERIAKIFSTSLPLRSFTLPIVVPTVDIAMLWHRRWDDEPGRIWLRQLILESRGMMLEAGRRKPS